MILQLQASCTCIILAALGMYLVPKLERYLWDIIMIIITARPSFQN